MVSNPGEVERRLLDFFFFSLDPFKDLLDAILVRARVRGPGDGESDGDGNELGSELAVTALRRTAWA